MVTRGDRRPPGIRRHIDLVFIVAISYLPFLLSSPGRVSADSRQALYVDPAEFLAGAPYLWDPGSHAGTVPHQTIGYLWPMGPWFWAFEQLGVPDWVAQRLWWGTLTCVAALGARWLLRGLGAGRLGALAGALVYALTPFQLAFTARLSVILLPWAGLPALVELARRAVRRGGWRHPALFALAVFSVAGVNATALFLLAPAPLITLVWIASEGRESARAALRAGARIALLTSVVCLWWLAGLRVQGSHGMPVLQLTENLETVTRWSSPLDVLRGLGNWFFYGSDRLGFSIDQAAAYLDDPKVVALSLAVPVLGVAAVAALRGRSRFLAASLLFSGVLLSVGAWPYGDPTPYGRLFRAFAEETSAGLAFRNSARAVPLLVLGFAIALGTGVSGVGSRALRRVAAGVVALAAIGGLAPALAGGFMSGGVDRPGEIPGYWQEAATELDGSGGETRVLEVPGANFAAYRWGNAIEPVTPALIDRPYLAREVLPYGSPQTANLLDALDRRIQHNILEAQSVAPVARLLGVGAVVLRSDLQYERFRTPRPTLLWEAFGSGEAMPGLVPWASFGHRVADDEAEARLAPLDEHDLAARAERPEPAAVTIFEVEDPVPIVRIAPAGGAIVLEGDGDGIVDAAAAGLVDGRAMILYAAATGDDLLERSLARGSPIILTDSNRRRIQTWFFALRDTRGPTERSGETLVEPTGYDMRLEPFSDGTDDDRSVTVQHGAQVTATSPGGGAGRPEDRPAAALDGDLATSWRVGGANPVGHRISIVLPEPIEVDRIRLLQPLDGPRDRSITRARLHLDGSEPIELDLGAESFTAPGQTVELARQSVARFEVEIVAVSTPPFDPTLANAVGFAEIDLGGATSIESVRLPVALMRRLDGRDLPQSLDVVMTRLRLDPAERGRTDEERRLDRTFELGSSRSFGLTGTARLNTSAPDPVLDALLGDVAAGSFAASSRLAGDLGSRAARAFDGDLSTAWTAAFGPQEGEWLEVAVDEPVAIERLWLDVVADGRHSTPTAVRVEADGRDLGTHLLEPLEEHDGLRPHAIALDATVGETLRLTIEGVERLGAPLDDPAPMATLPVSIAEVRFDGTPHSNAGGAVLDTGCREDLVLLDGQPLAVRVRGDIGGELAVDLCETEIALAEGEHRLVTTAGHLSGVDLDRLVLSSEPGGGPGSPGVRGRMRSEVGGRVAWLTDGRSSLRVGIRSDGAPFWLVLGQSSNDGWHAESATAGIGERQLVDGYANAWLVRPSAAGLIEIELEWRPQSLAWRAVALSGATVLICLAIALATPRSSRTEDLETAPPVGLPSGLVGGLAGATVVALAVTLASRPAIGAVSGAVALAVASRPDLRFLGAGAGAGAVILAEASSRPSLAWLALGLATASVAGPALGSWFSRRLPAARRAPRSQEDPPGPASGAAPAGPPALS